MRIQHLIGLLLPAGLAACATPPPQTPAANPWDVMTAGLERFRGHDIRELAAVLGYPGGQREFMGDTVFVWRQDVSAPIPNGFADPTFVQIQCTIEVAATDGIIKTYHLSGQGGACWRFANALR